MVKQKSEVKKAVRKNKLNKYQLIGAFSLATMASGIGFFTVGIAQNVAPEFFPKAEQSLDKNIISDSSAKKMLTGSGLFMAGTMVGMATISMASIKSSRRKPKPPKNNAQ